MRSPTECSISDLRQDASNPFDSRNHSQVMGTGIDSRTGQSRAGAHRLPTEASRHAVQALPDLGKGILLAARGVLSPEIFHGFQQVQVVNATRDQPSLGGSLVHPDTP